MSQSLGCILTSVERRALDASSLERIARARTIGRAVRDHRVGGEFWAPPLRHGGAPRVFLKPLDPRQANEMTMRALEGCAAAQLHALLPRRRWAGGVARRLDRLGVGVSTAPVDPWSILDVAQRVMVDETDELGFLARLSGVESQAYSMEGVQSPRRDRAVSPAPEPERLTEAVLIEGVIYRDPFDGGAISCEAVVEILADWRRLIDANRNIADGLGVTWWKRRRVRQFLFRGEGRVSFHADARAAVNGAAKSGGSLAVWPSRAPADIGIMAAKAGVPLVRLEDGFVRSVGLGSNLHPPYSIVADRRGLYYDPATPSDLEALLLETDFSQALLERARRLIAALVEGDVTKYNLKQSVAVSPPVGRKLVLVAGQVEDDLSVTMGGAGLAGNLDFIQRVKALEPDAFILYKPHPDVDGGHRKGAVPDRLVLDLVDRIVRRVSTNSLLGAVDRVHTISSLIGFEALLRGRGVVTHGSPFYSGWGLTEDLAPVARRTRRLTLPELVAGALILYPRYIDPRSDLPCPVEVVVRRVAEAQAGDLTPLQRLRSLQGRMRRRLAEWAVAA